jgi:hypothetical protein
MADPSPAALRLVDELLSIYLSVRGVESRQAMARLVDAALAHERRRTELAKHDRAAYCDAMLHAQAQAAAAEARLRELIALYEPADGRIFE